MSQVYTKVPDTHNLLDGDRLSGSISPPIMICRLRHMGHGGAGRCPGGLFAGRVLARNGVVARNGMRAWGIRRLRMIENEHVELKAQLERLRQEHRDLDAAIEALQAVPGADAIQVQRLKKRRLGLRDRITFIEDQLTPDIIA
jgi:hypothetical protein